MRSNREGSFDRDNESRGGYKAHPSGFRVQSGQPPGSMIGHGGTQASYGYPKSQPASGSYPSSSQYPRGGRPGGPPPPSYGPPPDRPHGGEPPRNEDRREGNYAPAPERGFPPGGYDRQYKSPTGRMSYDRTAPRPSGPYPGRYDGPPANMTSSPRTRYEQPPFDHTRGAQDEHLNPLKQNCSHSSGSADSREGEALPKRGAPPGHDYSEAPPSHRYPPPNGPPRAIDHHGRHTSPSYESAYPPAYGNPEYESDLHWGANERGHHGAPHAQQPHGATARGRYGAYGGDAGRDLGSAPPPSAAGGHPYKKLPQAHQSQVHTSQLHNDYSGGAYRYEDKPGTPPPEERPQQRKFDDRRVHPDESASGIKHDEDQATYQSHRMTDIAPSSDISQPGQGSSPNDIVASHRDDVANMGCTCKKSKCLKLYCQCFAASVMCGPNCRCLICHNTPRHAYARKDAIRAILARNPQAFETKFKSTNHRVTTDNGRVLAHKSGCKCRKSACLKKYCECYHAGVKCSANCRCIGCQNMPPGGFGPGTRPEHSLMARSFAADVYSMKNRYEREQTTRVVGKKPGKGGEPWMVDAAQNLTFLKNASPQRPENRRVDLHGAQEYPSMPSLASSDTAFAPEFADGTASVQAGRPYISSSNALATPEAKKPAGKSVNTLLMAAYAMTELHSTSSPSKDVADRNAPPPPPADALGTPDQSVSKDRKYRSPKRKSDDEGSPLSAASRPRVVFREEESGSRSSIGRTAEQQDRSQQGFTQVAPEETPAKTPVDQRKIKRTRVGSAKKNSAGEDQHCANGGSFQNRQLKEIDRTPRPQGPTSDSDEDNGGVDNGSAVEPDENEAPTKGEHTTEGATVGVLTPVSARCIDFRHMDMNRDGKLKVQMDLGTEVAKEKGETHDEKKTEAMDIVATS